MPHGRSTCGGRRRRNSRHPCRSRTWQVGEFRPSLGPQTDLPRVFTLSGRRRACTNAAAIGPRMRELSVMSRTLYCALSHGCLALAAAVGVSMAQPPADRFGPADWGPPPRSREFDWAPPPPPPGFLPPHPLERALDQDRDGEISVEEIAGAATSLASLDRNEDGKLSRDELRPAPPPRPREWDDVPSSSDQRGPRDSQRSEADQPRSDSSW